MPHQRSFLRIGLLTIVSLLLLIIGMQFFKSSSLFQKGRTFYVNYENIAGLTEGDPVNYIGYQIGTVKKTSLSVDKVVVTLRITDVIDIPEDSKFQIVNLDFMGNKAVKLIYGSGPPAANGATLIGLMQEDIQEDIRDAFSEEIIQRFDQLLKGLEVLDSLGAQ